MMRAALVVSVALGRGWPSRFVPLFLAGILLWIAGERSAALPQRLRSAWHAVEKQRTILRSKVELRVGRGSTLLLASYGSAARSLEVVSACRHFFPIPRKRHQPQNAVRFEALPGYQENLNCFEQYRGKYVLLETKLVS